MSSRIQLARFGMWLALAAPLSLCAAGAQDAALPSLQEAPLHAEDAPRVLPVWNNTSGRFEALLLLEPASDATAPLDRVFSTNPLPAGGAGARLALPGGSRVQADVQLDPNAGLALLCDGVAGLSAPWVFGDQCLLAALGQPSPLPPSVAPSVDFTMQWQSADGGLDLDFGLSWLDLADHALLTTTAPLQATLADFPMLAQLQGSRLESTQMWLGGQLNLGQGRWFSLDGALGNQRWSGIGAASIEPLRWDTAQVTLGFGIRGFSSQIRARLIELPHSNTRYSGLDMGFSWRTPWHGVFSFGAKDLLNDGAKPEHWPMSELPALEAPGGRTPYVQYRQEL
ncbi:MAG: hypothetical protein R3F10_03250 [Lysobacteraceae bacterium]